MSHIAEVTLEVKDLEALAAAAKRIGMELVPSPTYKCWYTHMASQPEFRAEVMARMGTDAAGLMPTGYRADEIGKCEYAIRIPGNKDAYEVGIVRRRDGRPGYALLCDPEGELAERLGYQSCNLKREYAVVVATRQAMRQGFQVRELRAPNGSIQLQMMKA